MTQNFWPLAKDTWGDEEWEAIASLREAGRITIGPQVDAFETEFAKWHSMHMAVACNSGSSANLLAVGAIFESFRRRGKWIVPAMGWSTTYAPLIQYGHELVVVDVDETLGISIPGVLRALEDHPGIIGIMVVNVLGVCANLPALRRIADKHGLWLIEDNCESLGASIEGRKAGTWGDLGTFSFFFSHHMHTGEGGMVIAANPHLYSVCRSLRSHGWTRGIAGFNSMPSHHPRYAPFTFVIPGYNLRMMDLQAAPGRVQLKKLDGIIRARRENRKLAAKFLPVDKFKGREERGETSPMALPLRYLGSDFDAFLGRLDREGIEHRPVIAGNILAQKMLDSVKFTAYDTPMADDWHRRGFYVGLWSEPMPDEMFIKLGGL